MKKIERVEIFKVGKHREDDITYTAKELQEMADTYNPGVHEAPIVIGHDNDKAWGRSLSSKTQHSNGWVVKPYREGDSLYADIEVDDDTLMAMKNKSIKKRSIGLYRPDSYNNPSPGKWSIRHLALLGAETPQVKGLKDITIYTEELVFEEVEVESSRIAEHEVFGEVTKDSLVEYNRIRDYQLQHNISTFREARRRINNCL